MLPKSSASSVQVKKLIKKLGTEQIREQQALTTYAVMSNIRKNYLTSTENKRTCLVCAPPQWGKTGTMIAIIDEFLNDCIKRNKTFQIIVICGLSETSLMQQTLERITRDMDISGKAPKGAQLQRKADNDLNFLPGDTRILVLNNTGTLKWLDFTGDGIDVRLIIIDECHIGNVEGGNIPTFLKTHGVEINKQIHAWDNQKTQNHVVLFSATPFAHLIKAEEFHLKGEALFTTIWCQADSAYIGMKEMLAKNRLLDIGDRKLIRNKKPSEFFNMVMSDFQAFCKKYGPRYLVIRAKGNEHDNLMKYINEEGSVDALAYDMVSDNLSDLNRKLSTKPLVPMIVVIRGSMRAGITLGSNNFIGAWLESGSKGADVQAQAGVGRACGYARKADMYPIYCNLEAVKEAMALYDALDNGELKSLTIPAGRHNKKAGAKLRTRRTIRLTPMPEKNARLIVSAIAEGQRASGKMSNLAQISTTKGNAAVNIADLLLRGKKDNGAAVGYLVNGSPTREDIENSFQKGHMRKHPTTKDRDLLYAEMVNSYTELLATNPSWEGMVIMLDIDDSVDIQHAQDRDNRQKKSSALKTVTFNRVVH